jgi:adenosylcobinamide-phosphate synthase
MSVRRAAVIALALAIDWRLGDPPTAVHPVGWAGRAADFARRRAPRGARARLRYGIVAPSAILAATGLGTLALQGLARRLPAPLALVLDAGALSLTVGLTSLLRRAEEVEGALAVGDLGEARALTGHHLVSRDTANLDRAGVAAATIESLAENLSDGVVAPLLAYAVAGLPGALVYRAANTLDSAWGYRSPEFLELGRHVARLDDALNLIPARASSAALVVATLLRGGALADARRAIDVWLDEGDFTRSPNAGQPMGAMAGALGVELAKDGEYRLGSGLPLPAPGDIARARALVLDAALLVAGVLITALVIREATREAGGHHA